MLLARILDLEVQLDRYRKAIPSPPKDIAQSAPDRRSSIWRKGLTFLRERRSSAGNKESADFATYWGEETAFRKFFDKLDHADIVQFGCANGEHAAILLQHYRPRTLTLVDGDQTNIDACAQRFAGRRNIIFARDTETDKIADGSRSAVFSYDHLIRLEHDDVAACLITIGRILQPGKYALLHHSANDGQPGVAAIDSRGGRAFMSGPLFSHLCARAGLFVVERAKSGELDELSLVQRISPLN